MTQIKPEISNVLCFFELMLYHHSKDFYFIFLVKFLLNLFYCTSSNLLLLWFCSTNFKSNKISYNNDQYQTLCFTDFYTEIRSCIRGPDFNNRKIITMFSTESTLKMELSNKNGTPKTERIAYDDKTHHHSIFPYANRANGSHTLEK